jgi:hypothetical protein
MHLGDFLVDFFINIFGYPGNRNGRQKRNILDNNASLGDFLGDSLGDFVINTFCHPGTTSTAKTIAHWRSISSEENAFQQFPVFRCQPL